MSTLFNIQYIECGSANLPGIKEIYVIEDEYIETVPVTDGDGVLNGQFGIVFGEHWKKIQFIEESAQLTENRRENNVQGHFFEAKLNFKIPKEIGILNSLKESWYNRLLTFFVVDYNNYRYAIRSAQAKVTQTANTPGAVVEIVKRTQSGIQLCSCELNEFQIMSADSLNCGEANLFGIQSVYFTFQSNVESVPDDFTGLDDITLVAGAEWYTINFTDNQGAFQEESTIDDIFAVRFSARLSIEVPQMRTSTYRFNRETKNFRFAVVVVDKNGDAHYLKECRIETNFNTGNITGRNLTLVTFQNQTITTNKRSSAFIPPDPDDFPYTINDLINVVCSVMQTVTVTAESSKTVIHNLGRIVTIVIIDSNNDQVQAPINQPTDGSGFVNSFTVDFGQPFTGTIYYY